MRIVIIAKFTVVAWLTALSTMPLHAAPARPSDDQLVLLDSAVQASAPTRQISDLQSRLASDPSDLENAIALARAAIEAGRNLGDTRFYGQAEAALAPWWDAADAPEDVVILRATIRQAFHDFKPALTDLDHVIAGSPYNIQARFSRAFIRMVTGDFSGAEQDCDTIRLQRFLLVREICMARLGALTGKNRQAFSNLQQVQHRQTDSNPALAKFAKVVLADIAVSIGDAAAADALYRDATADRDVDVATLAAYADVLLATKRPGDALALLEGRGEADALVLRRTIAAKQTHDPRWKNWSNILRERFAANAASNNRVHLREEARFQMDVEGDPDAAVELAIANWTTQKEPADAELLLATALAAGRPAAATPVRDFVRDAGLSDARLASLLEKLGQQELAQ